MKDEEIIALYREGEREKAFNEIVRNYSERLYWHVRGFVCSHEDTDDILQDIFIKIWNALPRFRGEARLFTWLYSIATNEVLNFLRKRRLKSVLSFTSEEKVLIGQMEADPYFNGDEAQKKLMLAIGKLPEKQRLVFVMRYFEEMEYQEISEILKTSVGSLKASYHHAYVKIKNEIEKDF